MGAWSEHPIGNDSALDYCFDIEKKTLPELICEGLKSHCYEKIRAAAWLLKKVFPVYPIFQRDEVAELAIKSLKIVQEDTNWIKEWKNPTAVESSLNAYIDYFKKTLERK